VPRPCDRFRRTPSSIIVRTIEGIKAAVLNTEKSNQNVAAIFPVMPELEKIIAPGPYGDLT
jgi:hypothetical protein